MKPCFYCGTYDGRSTPPNQKNIALQSSPYGPVCKKCINKGLKYLYIVKKGGFDRKVGGL